MQAASGVRCGGMQQWSVNVDKDEVMMRQMKLDGRGDCGPQISGGYWKRDQRQRGVGGRQTERLNRKDRVRGYTDGHRSERSLAMLIGWVINRDPANGDGIEAEIEIKIEIEIEIVTVIVTRAVAGKDPRMERWMDGRLGEGREAGVRETNRNWQIHDSRFDQVHARVQPRQRQP
ncbi:uncharacterized protein UMAG_03472 [Mycosarcoma maydis]|uniref:Uncharacterized protein n=1 Tax=Mycosarcoma maydis TaxID=5270 RepID=A0A0D1CNZ9_MYCMD|nr:uncharacterized protein UMAG_03472 [Ustilago maydis 521]KIS68378.1 hypothetical protein UMAG_03472 [Ustilago maydis 521]|eukprot:XP_011389928.1 hypothetical protein UMAG_03472 [Ustilago maydis 521]